MEICCVCSWNWTVRILQFRQGASGAVFAVMGAMIYAVIRGRGHIEDLSARQVVIMAAFSLLFWFLQAKEWTMRHM